MPHGGSEYDAPAFPSLPIDPIDLEGNLCATYAE
jgi:hypothetical protein